MSGGVCVYNDAHSCVPCPIETGATRSVVRMCFSESQYSAKSRICREISGGRERESKWLWTVVMSARVMAFGSNAVRGVEGGNT